MERKEKLQKLKEKLSEITDPRRQYGNLLHKLWEMLVIALLTVICCGEDYDDMEEFGKERIEWLRDELGLELKNGVADGDTFERVFERIKPTEFRTKLNESLEYVRALRDVVNFDGKTKRGSGCKSKKKNPIHIISAFACENRLVLGEIASENKKTEIKEIPKLIEQIDIYGSIATIDAIGCQKEIVEKIIDSDADYVIGLKKNQRKLHDAVEEHFMNEVDFYDVKHTEEQNGSRHEQRDYWLLTDTSWLPMREEWCCLNSVGMVKSAIERAGKMTFEIRYFATSLTDVEEFAYAVRSHWSIENHLHWSLDFVWREDSKKGGRGNAALNMNILTKHALHLIDKADLSKFTKMGKPSRKRKRLKATLNPEVLISMVLSAE